MSEFDYLLPESLDEAFRLKAELPEARFVAGGTDLMVRVREGRVRPAVLVSLTRVAELAGIRHDERIRIGALTRVADLALDPEVGRMLPALVQAADTLGSVQVRNLATVGGNLCNASPCADLAPPLLVADATVVIRSPRAERELALADFFVAPGETRLGHDEIVVEIRVPRPSNTSRAAFTKQSRVRMDISLASLAVLLDFDGSKCCKARAAAGSVAPRPVRLHEVEALLEGRELTKSLIQQAKEKAMAEVRPISDVRASAAYRRHLAGVLVQRALTTLSGVEAS